MNHSLRAVTTKIVTMDANTKFNQVVIIYTLIYIILSNFREYKKVAKYMTHNYG